VYKILVIEDDKMVRTTTLEVIRAEGYKVAEAADGVDGVKLAEEWLPDLIVCDVNMPRLDGYGVLTRLRELEKTSAIPFIFLTGRADKTDLRQGMLLGADDYLTKPFTRSELIGAISARLAKKAAISQHYSAELRQVEEKLDYALHYDIVTGLPKRDLLEEHFQQLADPARRENSYLAVMALGLDRFGRITDSLGHTIGDRLLLEVAERLRDCLDGRAKLAYLQTAHYAIVPLSYNSKEEIIELIQEIMQTLSRSFMIEGFEVFVNASLGVSLYPEDNREFKSLLMNAEMALFQARRQGSSDYQFYSPNRKTQTLEQLALETSLRYALERDELEVYYQPQVKIEDGEVAGVEALVRWHNPERGMVSPAQFIPLAEETGLIIPIGEWVLRTACAQTRAWQLATGLPLRIAVNLSGRQFRQPELKQKIVQILEETGLPPSSLELEITESILIANPETAVVTLRELKELGVQIAVDDFGTGYSSLSYLKQFPLTTLKIDRCFISNVQQDTGNAAITKATIQMAHDLRLKAIAEGVETEDELSFLYQERCDEIQGYLFSRPLPRLELEKLLVTPPRLRAKI
jgi:diguanylate cyclase (GGDEF)-like protein